MENLTWPDSDKSTNSSIFVISFIVPRFAISLTSITIITIGFTTMYLGDEGLSK